MLERDYDALSACSPDVPEITTGGRRLKVWERRDDGIFLIKEPRHPEDGELLGIKLASDMCYRLFGEGYHVPANIEERDGKPYSVSPIMLGPDEELVDGNRLFRIAGLQDEYDRDVAGGASPGTCQNRIGVYEALGVANASAHVAKMASCACLSLFADLHGGNFGAIRKVGTKSWRAAPLYDFDECFGQSDSDTMLPVMLAHPYIAKIFCASAFSFLDPSWDWSWYDPQSIEGFEDHISETYSPLANSRPGFAELTASLFVMQRSYVNDTAAG